MGVSFRRIMRISAELAAATILVLMAAGFALAEQVNVDDSGIALQGHDPVAYFTEDRAVEGDEAISAEHEGATYRFVSEENRAAFEAAPEKYLPAYGGFCAFGMSQGYKAPVEPDKFTIVEGKLYLNYNGAVQNQWREDIAGYNERADAEWNRFLRE